MNFLLSVLLAVALVTYVAGITCRKCEHQAEFTLGGDEHSSATAMIKGTYTKNGKANSDLQCAEDVAMDTEQCETACFLIEYSARIKITRANGRYATGIISGLVFRGCEDGFTMGLLNGCTELSKWPQLRDAWIKGMESYSGVPMPPDAILSIDSVSGYMCICDGDDECNSWPATPEDTFPEV